MSKNTVITLTVLMMSFIGYVGTWVDITLGLLCVLMITLVYIKNTNVIIMEIPNKESVLYNGEINGKHILVYMYNTSIRISINGEVTQLNTNSIEDIYPIELDGIKYLYIIEKDKHLILNVDNSVITTVYGIKLKETK